MQNKPTHSPQMNQLTEPARVVKASGGTIAFAGFDHDAVRRCIPAMVFLSRLPSSEEYTLMEHKKTGARGIWLEILYSL